MEIIQTEYKDSRGATIFFYDILKKRDKYFVVVPLSHKSEIAVLARMSVKKGLRIQGIKRWPLDKTTSQDYEKIGGMSGVNIYNE